MSRVRLLASRLRPIVSILGPHRRLFAIAAIAGMANQLLLLVAAALGAWIVGRAVTGDPVADLTAPLAWFAVTSIAAQVLNVLDGWCSHVMSWRALHDLRIALHRKFDDLGPAYLLERRSGDVARVALADVSEIEIYTSHVLPPMLAAAVVPLGATIGAAVLHPLLAIALAPFLIGTATVPFWLGRRAEEQGERARSSAGGLASVVIDGLQGMRELAAFRAEAGMTERIRRAQAEMIDATLLHARRVAVERVFTIVLLSSGMLATLVTGAWLVSSGRLDSGLFPAAVVLAGAAFMPVLALTTVGGELQRIAACADRIWTILDAQPSVRFDQSDTVPGEIGPRVEFDRVTFRYRHDLDPALVDASFAIEPGQTVALVGHSGAGKSTAAHLLQRLWDPQSGTISIGGHDVRRYPEHQLRSLVATVPQDVYLFNTTVIDNLRIGRPDASLDEVRAAAEQARALEFIDALPDGFDTVLGERGATLSGGQRQRLAIARALLHDAPVLVFDEAVSNLDTESEAEIRHAMSAAAKGRTTFVIAHRSSTIRAADHVVVLERGRVVEQGAYEPLVASGGALTRLLHAERHPQPTESSAQP